MKNKGFFFMLLIFFSLSIYAAVYVKGNLRFEPFYDSGVLQPDESVVYEWWFGKKQVSFLTPRWRFTLDREKNYLIAANLDEQLYVKISLPVNRLSHVDRQLSDSLKQYSIDGSIKKIGEKRIFLKKKCEVYSVSEWIVFQGQRFYDRERTMLATEDVSFDWELLNDLYAWIRSFFNPRESYQKELKKINGFIMASDDIRFQEGEQVKYHFTVLEIKKKGAPEFIFDIPKDFKNKENFTRSELIDIRTTYYFYYR